MATTTPNFGWAVPTSSDLVKNGATAIETLGDAIDASLVDLKGGTTGQVLTKASDTDMDFSWATASGGSNTFYAGKNKIINGDFRIWQRGTSFSLTGPTQTFGADRFQATGNATYSRQSFTAGTAPVAGYEGQYFARWDITSNSANYDFGTRLEDVRIFAGQTVTLSFWAKASATTANAFFPRLQQNFGTGGSPSSAVYTDGSNISLTTSWARYSVTLSVPSISGKTLGTNGDSFLKPMVQLVTTSVVAIDFWGWQLEAGSSATAFQTATGTIQGETSACQRYYWRLTGNAAGYYRLADSGFANSTTDAHLTIPNPVTMRVTPTSVDYAGVYLENYIGAGSKAATAITINNVSSPHNSTANVTVASGLTAGTRYFGFLDNNTSSYIGYSAEL